MSKKNNTEVSRKDAKNQADVSKQGLRKVIFNNMYILKFVHKHSPGYLFLVIFVAAFQEIEVFFEFTFATKFITDTIQYNGSFNNVLIYLVVIFLVVLFKLTFFSNFYNNIAEKAKEKLNRELRSHLFKKASELDLACYDNPEFYNDYVWSIKEAGERIDITTTSVSILVSCLATIITSGALFITLNWVGLIFIAVSLTSSVLLNLSINRLKLKADTEIISKTRKRDYIGRVFYMADYAKEIRLSDVSNKLKNDFQQTNNEIISTVKKYSGKQIVLSFLSDFLCSSFLLNGVYMVYLVFLAAVEKSISYGSLIALFNSTWRLKSNLQRFTTLLPMIQENSFHIGKVLTLLNYEQKVKECENPQELPVEPPELELKDVSFNYDNKSKKTLRKISLKINPYEKIAFVGYNGAGKTTITKLLMRLYDVTEGEILLNGINIKNYKLSEYRNNIGAVFQDYQLIAASIKENVLMDTCDFASDGSVIDALERSGFSQKLNNLNDGINTLLTREFDDTGVNLSGGEAQKVAIARVLAKDCKIIILDEPSSALDPISEYNLNQTLLEAAKNKTVIFISHRLSTTRMADRIYMFEGGAVVEEGTHDELIAFGGKYAQMFNLQAEKYRFIS